MEYENKYYEVKMIYSLKEIKKSYLNDKNILGRSFYSRNTSMVAGELIGKILVRICGPVSSGRSLSGIIVETEAYYGAGDPASHACRGRTPRSEIMFGRAGMAYVYFCYGMYYLLNAVTEEVNTPGAVLIRAAWPLDGIELMKKRRLTQRKEIKSKDNFRDEIINAGNKTSDAFLKSKHLADGPGKLTVCFGIDISDNKKDLTNPSGDLKIYDCGIKNSLIKISTSPRVGLSSGKELNLRYMAENINMTEKIIRVAQ
jgi:DNA-3-methyladenine glycosylase